MHLLISIFLISILPLVIAVMGYLCFFYALNWLYLLIVLGVWIVSVVITITCSDSKGRGLSFYYEGVGGGVGWVWIVFIPATLWFLVSAVFYGGSWSKFIYTFLIGSLAKATAREFQNSSAELRNEILSGNSD